MGGAVLETTTVILISPSIAFTANVLKGLLQYHTMYQYCIADACVGYVLHVCVGIVGPALTPEAHSPALYLALSKTYHAPHMINIY